MRRLLSLCLLLPSLVLAAPPAEQWFSVLLDGRKVGHFENRRVIDGDRVVTTQTLDLALERAGSTVTLGSVEYSEESLDGAPLAFRSSSRISGSENTLEGRVRDGRVQVRSDVGGHETTREVAWPVGALLPEGMRLLGLKAGLSPGTRYRALAFQPSSLDAVEVTSTVGADEALDLPDGARRAYRIDQVLAFPDAPVHSIAWIDAEQTVYKLSMPVLGVDLILLACDRACALAPNQSTDIFQRTIVAAPRALGVGERAGALRYVIATQDGKPPQLPQTDEQHVSTQDGETIVEVRAQGGETTLAPPVAADSAPNDWLQSRAPDVVALARQAAGEGGDDGERMRRLEAFVRGYIRNKNLDVGYASALEVVRSREGDCTEHAVLLAALGRALGIPTRVATGLAYAADFAGRRQSFVPHAWTMAWVDGRWRSYDAALAGFDAGHLALAVGDGDPWRFYAGMDLLGRLELRRVEAMPPSSRAATR